MSYQSVSTQSKATTNPAARTCAKITVPNILSPTPSDFPVAVGFAELDPDPDAVPVGVLAPFVDDDFVAVRLAELDPHPDAVPVGVLVPSYLPSSASVWSVDKTDQSEKEEREEKHKHTSTAVVAVANAEGLTQNPCCVPTCPGKPQKKPIG